MSFSYWEQQQFPGRMDACIIGAGITGMQAARRLKAIQPSWNICILDRETIPRAASSRNAGFACFGSPSELIDDLEHMPEDSVWSTVERRWKGLLALREDLGDAMIDYRPVGGYELFGNKDDTLYEQCADKVDWLNERLRSIVGASVFEHGDKLIKDLGLGSIKHVIANRYEGILDTGKLIKALWQRTVEEGVLVLRGVDVEGIHNEDLGVRLETSEGPMQADRVLIAVNGFYERLTSSKEVRPARAQVLLTEPIAGLDMPGAFHYDRGYYYFREIDNRILLGGGRQLDYEGETTTDLSVTEMIQSSLEKMLKEVIVPGKTPKIEMRWSGIMGVGDSKEPMVKQLDERTYCAVRLGGMGVALGTTLGRDAAELMGNN